MSEKSAAEMAAEMEVEMEAGNVESVLDLPKYEEKLETTGEQGEQVETKPEPAKAEEPAKVDASQTAPAGNQEELEAPILGGGGKAIPYSVLKEARQRASDRDQIALERDQLRRQLDEVRAQQGAKPVTDAEVAKADDSIYDDMPEPLAKRWRAMESQVQELREREQLHQQREQQAVAQAAATAAEQSQAAIDSIPQLAEWQAEGGEKWAAAAAADARLANSAAWRDKPLTERFQKALQLASIELGLAEPSAPSAPVTKETKTTAPKPAATPALTSLTDLAGGGMPAVDDAAFAEESTTRQLAVRMASMNSADIDRWLRETG